MDFTGFTTPKTERGTPARGTLVATDQSTPAQSGAYGGADQLIGTDARKAKQAQRREAREAKRRTLLAALGKAIPHSRIPQEAGIWGIGIHSPPP